MGEVEVLEFEGDESASEGSEVDSEVEVVCDAFGERAPRLPSNLLDGPPANTPFERPPARRNVRLCLGPLQQRHLPLLRQFSPLHLANLLHLPPPAP